MVKGGTLTDRLRTDLELLRRRMTLLKAVEEHQPIGIMRLSKLLGHPQHRVRYGLRVLEQEGLIRPSREGAIITRRVGQFRKELLVALTEVKESVETLIDSL